MTDKDYREGCDEDEQEVSEIPVKEATAPIPNTAFLVLAYNDGRIELATELPDLNMDHVASMREIRDLSRSLADDLQANLMAKATSKEMLRVLGEAQNRIVSAKGPIPNLRPGMQLVPPRG